MVAVVVVVVVVVVVLVVVVGVVVVVVVVSLNCDFVLFCIVVSMRVCIGNVYVFVIASGVHAGLFPNVYICIIFFGVHPGLRRLPVSPPAPLLLSFATTTNIITITIMTSTHFTRITIKLQKK